MVNPLQLLAATGARLQERDYTTSWTTIVPTYISDASTTLTLTAAGYYYPTKIPSLSGSGLVAAISTANITTDFNYPTLPLTSVFTPPTSCSSAWTLSTTSGGTPTFRFAFGTGCVPDTLNWVDVYSPGICPSGYSIALSVTVGTSTRSGVQVTETQGRCCPK
jgi:hypothetical protein